MNKKNKSNIYIFVVLVTLIVLVYAPIKTNSSTLSSGQRIISEYYGKTEEEIYQDKKLRSGDELLEEIMLIEKDIKEGEEIILLPYAIALLEKQPEFSENKIMELLSDSRTGPVLQTILIKIYFEKGLSKLNLIPFLNSEMSSSAREYIIDLADLSIDELKRIYLSNNDSIATVAMKKILVTDDSTGFHLAKSTLDSKGITDDKLIASFLAIGEYYSNNKTDYDLSERNQIINKMKYYFDNSSNDLVKDNAIYSFARFNDFELFKYIIDNENIDFELKVSSIERNGQLLIDKIRSLGTTESLDIDYKYIVKAMQMHPLVEVGEALKESISTKIILRQDYETIQLIKFIEENGIEGALKYEKNK